MMDNRMLLLMWWRIQNDEPDVNSAMTGPSVVRPVGTVGSKVDDESKRLYINIV